MKIRVEVRLRSRIWNKHLDNSVRNVLRQNQIEVNAAAQQLQMLLCDCHLKAIFVNLLARVSGSRFRETESDREIQRGDVGTNKDTEEDVVFYPLSPSPEIGACEYQLGRGVTYNQGVGAKWLPYLCGKCRFSR